MSKICPKCGDKIPDEAHFCGNCGYEFIDSQPAQPDSISQKSLFGSGKIFLILIVVILVVGSAFILTSGMGNGNENSKSLNQGIDSSNQNSANKDLEMVITKVEGDSYTYDDYEGVKGETEYMLMTSALFYNVPADLKEYIIKTTYYDKNNESIAQQSEGLSTVLMGWQSSDYDYPYVFGIVSFYKKLEPEYATVEIIKDKNVIINETFEIDKNSINYL